MVDFHEVVELVKLSKLRNVFHELFQLFLLFPLRFLRLNFLCYLFQYGVLLSGNVGKIRKFYNVNWGRREGNLNVVLNPSKNCTVNWSVNAYTQGGIFRKHIFSTGPNNRPVTFRTLKYVTVCSLLFIETWWVSKILIILSELFWTLVSSYLSPKEPQNLYVYHFYAKNKILIQSKPRCLKWAQWVSTIWRGSIFWCFWALWASR